MITRTTTPDATRVNARNRSKSKEGKNFDIVGMRLTFHGYVSNVTFEQIRLSPLCDRHSKPHAHMLIRCFFQNQCRFSFDESKPSERGTLERYFLSQSLPIVRSTLRFLTDPSFKTARTCIWFMFSFGRKTLHFRLRNAWSRNTYGLIIEAPSESRHVQKAPSSYKLPLSSLRRRPADRQGWQRKVKLVKDLSLICTKEEISVYQLSFAPHSS